MGQKSKLSWQVTLALILIALGAFFYYVHWLVFRDVEHIFLYFIGDVAFVFFEVLLVTLVIHRLLHHREQKAVRDKINMLVGAFFSELGTELLEIFASFDLQAHKIKGPLSTPHEWSESEFLNIRNTVERHDSDIKNGKADFAAVDSVLRRNKNFLLDLIQNQSLLQNESFTNLVWAVYHLAKEMEHRGDLSDLPDDDHQHLSQDIARVYELMLLQWVDYMQHLRHCYPYMFSLAGRTNPFNSPTAVEVK